MKNNWQKVYPAVWLRGIEILKKEGVVILPTDTLYGIVASVFSKKAVERIYDIKGRKEDKPFIILISSLNDLKIFGIDNLPLPSVFKPKVSVILDCKNKKWQYIHRGKNSIAFRMISSKNKNLFNLIKKVGPIVAPSANPEGERPAETIKEAEGYFGDKIDLYINVGTKKSSPSTLVRMADGKIEILRQGANKIKL